jgi:hypothetical protein
MDLNLKLILLDGFEIKSSTAFVINLNLKYCVSWTWGLGFIMSIRIF